MREFRRIMTGPKQGVYFVRRAQSSHRNASTQPLLTIGFKCAGRSRQILSARWTELREIL
jgi:hypothetical protein